MKLVRDSSAYLPWQVFSKEQLVANFASQHDAELFMRASGHGQRKLGKLLLDPVTLEVTQNGKRIQIPALEARVLELLTRYNHVFTRDEVLKLWRKRPASNSLDVILARLRKRVCSDVRIETIKGLGFKAVY